MAKNSLKPEGNLMGWSFTPPRKRKGEYMPLDFFLWKRGEANNKAKEAHKDLGVNSKSYWK